MRIPLLLIVLLFFSVSLPLPGQNTVPVAIHIVSTGAQDPTADAAVIQSTLQYLNDYLGGDAGCGVLSNNAPIDIQLCPATRDAFGRPSNGVLHYQSPYGEIDACQDETALKSLPGAGELNPYPTTDYLNLYIVDEICNSCSAGNCLAGGFATLPGEHGFPLDGIVTERHSWFSNDCNDRKAILHELGHYFGLLHTFEGEACTETDCANEGDLVCDTAPDPTADLLASNPCLSGLSEAGCGSVPSPIGNLMDYAPLSCIYTFTPGQVTRMESQLSELRSSLLTSIGCTAPCTEPVSIAVDLPPGPLVPSRLYSIINNTTGGDSFHWLLNGTEIGTERNLDLTLIEVGFHELELRVEASSLDCNRSQTWLLEVECPIPSPNLIGPDRLAIGETATYLATIPNGVQDFYWSVNDVQVAGAVSQLEFLFPTEGTYYLEVIASSLESSCESRSVVAVSVGYCETGGISTNWPSGNGPFNLIFSESQITVDTASPEFSSAFEATMVAYDSLGNLLFWSNGKQILNDQNEELYDGLGGSPSAKNQVVVRRPNSDSLYDLFYPQFISGNDVSDNKLFHATVAYNPLDFTVSVVEEDIEILKPSTERVVAIRHCNGVDWWIVGRQFYSNRYSAFKLTEAGIVDTVHTFIGDTLFGETRAELFGELSASPDGSMIVHSNYAYTLPNEDHTVRTGRIDLFSFDNNTGELNNQKTVADSIRTTRGIQFSPDSRLLYFNATIGDRIPELFQVQIDNLSNTPFDSPVGTAINLAKDDQQEPRYRGGAIAKAPDGKFYVTNPFRPYISVINRPNVPGLACDFQLVGIDLEPYDVVSGLGFPQFPADATMPNAPKLDGPRIYNLCDQTTALAYRPREKCFYQPYTYELRSPGGSLLRISSDSAYVLPQGVGVDTLIVKTNTACLVMTDTLFLTISNCTPEVPLSFDWVFADTIICAGEFAELEFSTNAASVTLVDQNGNALESLSGKFHAFSPPLGQTTYGLYLRDTLTPFRDTTIFFSTSVGSELDFQWTAPPSNVCSGDHIDLVFTTEASSVVLLREDDNTIGEHLLTQNFQLGPFTQDSCYRLRLRQDDRGCEQWLNFCIEVEDLPVPTSASFIGCPGTPLLLSDTTIIDTGTLVRHFQNAAGCDSTHTITYHFYPTIDTTFLTQEDCLPGVPDIETLVAKSGCDSIVVTRYLPFPAVSDTTELTVLSCASPTDADTILLTNQYGCDSTVITTYAFDATAVDTTRLQLSSCFPQFPDTSILANQAGCDSLIIHSYLLFPTVSDTTRREVLTCTPSANPDTTLFANQFGCDSTVITSYAFDAAAVDTTRLQINSCDLLPTDTSRLSNQAGCDSLIIRSYLLFPTISDTTRQEVLSCSPPTNADTTLLANQFGCDSTVITTYAFDATAVDTTRLQLSSCFPQFSDTSTLANQAGCDSLIIRSYVLFPTVSDTTRREVLSCAPPINSDTLLLANQFGCDSTIITTYAFAAAAVDTTRLLLSSCSFLPADTTRMINQAGCDSLVITSYAPFPSTLDTVRLTTAICLPLPLPDTMSFTNQYGCDSTVILRYTLAQNAIDTTYIREYDCGIINPITDTIVYPSSAGCDSIVIIQIVAPLLPSVLLPASYSISPGDTIQLEIEQTLRATYFWTATTGELSCTNCPNPAFTTETSTTLQLTLIDSLGCDYHFTTDVLVTTVPDEVYFPSAFSPNDDGVNDTWRPFSHIETDIHWDQVIIYDRWGKEVFRSESEVAPSWSGDAHQVGTYIYVALYKVGERQYQKAGDIALLR
jgi:gliding motility-associated-like protein